MVKSYGCSSRRPRLDSLHSHGDPQASLAPVLGDLKPSSNLHKLHAHGAQTHIWAKYSYMGTLLTQAAYLLKHTLLP